MSEKIGETKSQILQSCFTPKDWAELLEITKKVSSTLSVHVNDLIDDNYLRKDDNKKTYQKTEKGVNLIELIPNVRALPTKEKPYELVRMVEKGITLGHFSFRERAIFGLLGKSGIEHDKNLKKIYLDVIQAIRESVIFWLPKGVEPDKGMYKEVNKLVGLYTKKFKENSGKITMVIEFNLPKAMDLVIREEKDGGIRDRLEKDRDLIINKVYKNWHRIFNQIF